MVRLAGAIEEPDVLGIAHRLHVGQVGCVGLHLGDEIAELGNHRPLVAAQIGQLDAEGARQVFLEDGFGPAEIARVDIARHERVDVEAPIELRGVRAKVEPSKACFVRVAAAVNPHLPLLRLRRRRKCHDAAAENHDAGDAGVRLRDERHAAGDAQLEVFGAERQVGNGVLLLRIERQAIQPAHGGQHVQRGDAPAVARRGAA